MPLQNYINFKKLNFKVFNYKKKINETEKILSKLKTFFSVTKTTITGVGFKKEEKDLITFEKIEY